MPMEGVTNRVLKSPDCTPSSVIECTQLMHERTAAPQAQQIVALQIDPFCAAYLAIAEAFPVRRLRSGVGWWLAR